MFTSDQYSLIDFGAGRKLERFAGLVVDRPSPPAFGAPRAPQLWKSADIRFEEDPAAESTSLGKKGENKALGRRGKWIPLTSRGERAASGESWTIRHQDVAFSLELKGSPFGHLGIFPEQSRNWDRLCALCREGENKLHRPIRVLNLFAYTGGSSLASAAGGAETTHLDAAQNIVKQARRNAELSGFGALPIRWIADDALKFVRREKKREKTYDGIILDPPTYGHGARGEVWRLGRDLPKLLDDLFDLLTPEFPFVLLTCHSLGFDAFKLRGLLEERADVRLGGRFRIETASMSISAENGGRLPAGEMALLTYR